MSYIIITSTVLVAKNFENNFSDKILTVAFYEHYTYCKKLKKHKKVRNLLQNLAKNEYLRKYTTRQTWGWSKAK